MKSYGVAIQMKPLQQYFHMVLFIQYVVLTFESVDEILWCHHLNRIFSAVLSRAFKRPLVGNCSILRSHMTLKQPSLFVGIFQCFEVCPSSWILLFFALLSFLFHVYFRTLEDRAQRLFSTKGMIRQIMKKSRFSCQEEIIVIAESLKHLRCYHEGSSFARERDNSQQTDCKLQQLLKNISTCPNCSSACPFIYVFSFIQLVFYLFFPSATDPVKTKPVVYM